MWKRRVLLKREEKMFEVAGTVFRLYSKKLCAGCPLLGMKMGTWAREFVTKTAAYIPGLVFVRGQRAWQHTKVVPPAGTRPRTSAFLFPFGQPAGTGPFCTSGCVSARGDRFLLSTINVHRVLQAGRCPAGPLAGLPLGPSGRTCRPRGHPLDALQLVHAIRE